MRGFRKDAKNNRFLTFQTTFDQTGQSWQIFEFSWQRKQKRNFFTLPKTSIHAKNKGNFGKPRPKMTYF